MPARARRSGPASRTTGSRLRGDPDMRKANASYVERHNLSMRMRMGAGSRG